EDGVRDFHVTGVQTCALPIFNPPSALMSVNDLLADIDLMLLNTPPVEQRRKQSHRVPRLILRRGNNLDPRRRVLHPNRLVPVKSSEERRVGNECSSLWAADRP